MDTPPRRHPSAGTLATLALQDEEGELIFTLKKKNHQGRKDLKPLAKHRKDPREEGPRAPSDDTAGEVKRAPRLLRRRTRGLDGGLWESGDVGMPHSALTDPKLATGRVTSNSRLRTSPGG